MGLSIAGGQMFQTEEPLVFRVPSRIARGTNPVARLRPVSCAGTREFRPCCQQ